MGGNFQNLHCRIIDLSYIRFITIGRLVLSVMIVLICLYAGKVLLARGMTGSRATDWCEMGRISPLPGAAPRDSDHCSAAINLLNKL